ncbi:putative toxin-antitoxin system, toxin component, RelE family [Escherichia coli MS 115-1]|nr:putative toxin-antitoxin system, toxin component, RelE family [Escherichia coli MS 115-1]
MLNSHLKPVRILRISGITATTIFGEERADRYINQLSAFFLFWSAHNIGTPRPELGEYILALPVE